MAKGWNGVELRLPNELGYDAKRPYRFGCPVSFCYYYVSCNSEQDAQNQERNHKCPSSGITKIGWLVTRTLVEQVWEKLDIEMKTIMEGHASDAMAQATGKARARAFAECLAIFMVPHFSTADEIAQEAVRRYKANLANEDYVTAGLGQRRYESAVEWLGGNKPAGGFTSDPAQAGGARQRRNPVQVKTPIRLSEKDQSTIKTFAAAGGFSNEMLAQTFGVSVEVIESILAT